MLSQPVCESLCSLYVLFATDLCHLCRLFSGLYCLGCFSAGSGCKSAVAFNCRDVTASSHCFCCCISTPTSQCMLTTWPAHDMRSLMQKVHVCIGHLQWCSRPEPDWSNCQVWVASSAVWGCMRLCAMVCMSQTMMIAAEAFCRIPLWSVPTGAGLLGSRSITTV